MVHEVVKVELYGANRDGDARRFTCASGTAISKGTILVLTSPRTVTGMADNQEVKPVAGIAAMDKSGTDYSTSITAWTNGIFEMYASGAIARGRDVILSDTTNFVAAPSTATAAAAASGAAILGYALEDASGNDVINVRLRL